MPSGQKESMLTENIPLNILISTGIAFFVAGGAKIIITYLTKEKIDFTLAFTTGGMPSSHGATVTALATSVFLHEGLSTAFVISLFFAVIVMVDAIGVRFETGRQGMVLNRLMKKHKVDEDTFNEHVGHTPLQVLVGALLGCFLAFLFYAV